MIKCAKEKPDKTAILFQPNPPPKVKKLPPMSVPEPPKKAEVVPQEPAKPKEDDTEDDKTQNKYSVNIPAYVPIATISINDMFSSSKYFSNMGADDRNEPHPQCTQTNDSMDDNDNKEHAGSADNKKHPKQGSKNHNKAKGATKKKLERKTQPFAAVAVASKIREEKKPPVPEKIVLPKTKPKTTPKSASPLPYLPMAKGADKKPLQIKEQGDDSESNTGNTQPIATDELIPHPEKYNEHLVHTYSLPKALPACKRTKVYSEAEMFDQEKYSKESVLAAVYPKISGLAQNKRQGFKGAVLPIGEMHKTRLSLTKVKGDGFLGSSRTDLDKTGGLELYATNPIKRMEDSSKRSTFILENEFIKEKVCNDDNTGSLKLPDIAGKETAELLEKVKEQKVDPLDYVNENNKLINALLNEVVEGETKPQVQEMKEIEEDEDSGEEEKQKELPINPDTPEGNSNSKVSF